RTAKSGQLMPQIARARRGAVLIAALVCLLVLTLLCGVLLRIALLDQRQQRMSEWRAQATWIAEAGLERAAASIGHSTNYSGETWQISETELSPGYAGLVVIEVPPQTKPGQKVICVRADYLRDGERVARVSKQLQVTTAGPALEKEP